MPLEDDRSAPHRLRARRRSHRVDGLRLKGRRFILWILANGELGAHLDGLHRARGSSLQDDGDCQKHDGQIAEGMGAQHEDGDTTQRERWSANHCPDRSSVSYCWSSRGSPPAASSSTRSSRSPSLSREHPRFVRRLRRRDGTSVPSSLGVYLWAWHWASPPWSSTVGGSSGSL